MSAGKPRGSASSRRRAPRRRPGSLSAAMRRERRGSIQASALGRGQSSSRRAATSDSNVATAALSLAEIQRRVDAWIMQFEEGYWPPLSMLARLSEEVGELARELNHQYGHKPKKADELPGDIALEVADIIFVLTCLCNSLQIDMTQAFERVLAKYTHRDARRWTPRSGR